MTDYQLISAQKETGLFVSLVMRVSKLIPALFGFFLFAREGIKFSDIAETLKLNKQKQVPQAESEFEELITDSGR